MLSPRRRDQARTLLRWASWPIHYFIEATFREGESHEERKRKRLMIPIEFYTLMLCGWWCLLKGRELWGLHLMTFTYAAVGVMSFCLLGSALATRKVPLRVVEVGIVLASVAVLVADCIATATGYMPRMWFAVICCMNLFAVLDARPVVDQVLVAIVLLYLALVQTEIGARWGLFDLSVIEPTDAVRDRWAGCASAPCAIGALSSFFQFLLWSMIFVLCCQVPRRYATGMREQLQIVDGVVVVAGRIAELLAKYSVDEAQELVDGEAGERLPAHLRQAYQKLLRNLTEIQPYLPASVLIAATNEDDVLMSLVHQSPMNCNRAPSNDVAAPKGCVAICFTDIVGSTKMWEASPMVMEEALDTHNAAIRRQIVGCDGYEVKTIGDSFMCSFQNPALAVLFGARVQEVLLGATWPEDPDIARESPKWLPQYSPDGELAFAGICVRIGISYGVVRDENNPITSRVDYRGPAVNLAARLENKAPHGAVHISQQCFNAVQHSRHLSGVTFSSMPSQKLKGIGEVDTFLATSRNLKCRIPMFFVPNTKQVQNKSGTIRPDLRRISIESLGTLGQRSKSTDGRETMLRAVSPDLALEKADSATTAVTTLPPSGSGFGSRILLEGRRVPQSGLRQHTAGGGGRAALTVEAGLNENNGSGHSIGRTVGRKLDSVVSNGRASSATNGTMQSEDNPGRTLCATFTRSAGGQQFFPLFKESVASIAVVANLGGPLPHQVLRRDGVHHQPSGALGRSGHASVAPGGGARVPAAAFHGDAVGAEAQVVIQLAVQHCVTGASRTRGMVSAIAGTTAQVTWNLIVPCASHGAGALQFAALIDAQRQVVDAADSRHSRGSGAGDGDGAAVGVASGAVLHGGVGTRRQRFHTVIGVAPRAADALAGAAVRLGAPCLACFLPVTPAPLRSLLRPVDRWGVGEGEDAITLSVEQPLFDDVRSADLVELELRTAWADDSPAREREAAQGQKTSSTPKSPTSPRSPRAADAFQLAAYRVLYDRALAGEAEGVSGIERFVATHPDDPTLAEVLRALRVHVTAHPGGHPYRVAAPFLATGALPAPADRSDGMSAQGDAVGLPVVISQLNYSASAFAGVSSFVVNRPAFESSPGGTPGSEPRLAGTSPASETVTLIEPALLARNTPVKESAGTLKQRLKVDVNTVFDVTTS